MLAAQDGAEKETDAGCDQRGLNRLLADLLLELADPLAGLILGLAELRLGLLLHGLGKIGQILAKHVELVLHVLTGRIGGGRPRTRGIINHRSIPCISLKDADQTDMSRGGSTWSRMSFD